MCRIRNTIRIRRLTRMRRIIRNASDDNTKNSSFDQGCVGELGMRRTINTKNSSFDQGCVG